MKVEVGHASEVREGGKKQTSAISTDARAAKVQAGDARVKRQRVREESATSLFEVSLILYIELCERRVVGLDALQQLRQTSGHYRPL